MTALQADPKALLALLRQTRSLLAAHVNLGLAAYPARPELRRFLAIRPAPAARMRQPVRPEPPAPPEQAAAPALSLSEIARQLADCRRCSAAAEPAPGLGAEKPKLVVVGDCRLVSAANVLWSWKEDELFWRMMAAIQLDWNAVYVTNTVKCAQQVVPPSDKAVQGCLFWLEQELRSLRPVLLCAMGETAAWLLTGKKIPLLRLRGRLHPCCLPEAPQAQVLATYPPRLLLQHPELKRAAWEDLQLLQKRL